MTPDPSASRASTISPAKPAQESTPTEHMFTAGATSAPAPTASFDEMRSVLAAPETVNKPADTRTDETAPINMFLVRQLRETQRKVSRLIEGYLAFDEVHRKCTKARGLSEAASTGDPRGLREAVDEVNEAYSERPDFGDRYPALSEGLQVVDGQLEELLRTFRDATSPIYNATESQMEQRQKFASNVGQLLSAMLEQITKLRGFCRTTGLAELAQVSEFVESIFNSTEQAREEARAKADTARRQAFEGQAQSAPPTQLGPGAFRDKEAPQPGPNPFVATVRSNA